MGSDNKVASAVCGKTARACDSCIRKRARWYCAADDAFLCQVCDSSVHSANTLARRHERVRLQISSLKGLEQLNTEKSIPSWPRSVTRKARTPRHGKPSRKSEEISQDSHSPVPELGSGETSNEESEEQLVYRVPILDPFITSTNSNEHTLFSNGFDDFSNTMQGELSQGIGNLHGILPSEMELDQFSADVESLLGKGFDESFDMESLGLLDCEKKELISIKGENEIVKIENNDEEIGDVEIDLTRETFELNFDYDSLVGEEEEEEETKVGFGLGILGDDCEEGKSGGGNCNKRKLLSLDYEGVIKTWANQRSPWTTGDRPELDLNDCWPGCLGSCGILSHHYPFGGVMSSGHSSMAGDREARVSRYREKRRTRLFSKKIRYEVRKLNAEKRPRMKGRFVKRTANAALVPPPNAAFPLLGK